MFVVVLKIQLHRPLSTNCRSLGRPRMLPAIVIVVSQSTREYSFINGIKVIQGVIRVDLCYI